MKPRALVLQARGTNRDLDVMEALTLAGAEPTGAPLNDLHAGKVAWDEFQLLVVPGGFSYADALGAGKLLALDLTAYFADEIAAFVASGRPVIGICNGFQALVKAGILPGAPIADAPGSAGQPLAPRPSALAPPYTLTHNASGRFECRWVTLRPASSRCIWTQGLTELVATPVAHGEGNFQAATPAAIDALLAADQVALTYVNENGAPAQGAYPRNPNGSAADIAGVCNAQGNVLGLMPHPENHVHPWQHPRWTRGEQGHSGLPLFRNGVIFAAAV